MNIILLAIAFLGEWVGWPLCIITRVYTLAIALPTFWLE